MFDSLRAKLTRDAHLGFGELARKSVRMAQELASAPLYLRGVDEVGKGARTFGRPRIENLGKLTIGSGALLRSVNVQVELATGVDGTLTIGDDVRLNYGVSIGAMGSVTLGNRVRVGPYVMIIDTEFHGVYDRGTMPAPRPIVIEDDVWIGAKASILPGVRIGRGSIVGISSVVSTDVPPFTVMVGNPARPVKKLDPELFGK